MPIPTSQKEKKLKKMNKYIYIITQTQGAQVPRDHTCCNPVSGSGVMLHLGKGALIRKGLR